LVAGVCWRYFFPPLIGGAVTFGIVLMNNPLRLKRILSWMNPEETKDGVGYQAWQAMLALGSGGWTGLGLGNGRQKFDYLPGIKTDFIFANIGEELWLIATLGVVVAFGVLLLCGIYIAWNARDTFGTLLATGITFLIGLQAFINIGVVTGTLPTKGLPLPFISRGGSNLFLLLLCVGLLLSVASRAVSGNRIAWPNNGSKRDRRKPCWRWAGSPAPRRFWPATASARRRFFTRPIPFPAAPIAGSPRSWMRLSSDFPRRRGDCTVTRLRRPAHPCAGNSTRWTRRRVGLTSVSMLTGRCCWRWAAARAPAPSTIWSPNHWPCFPSSRPI